MDSDYSSPHSDVGSSSNFESRGDLTKNQKKNKRRRKRNKSKRGDVQSVTFSVVSVRSFERTLGVDAVPGIGGWPLGMKLDDHIDHDQVQIDDYEARQQQKLIDRWKVIQSTEVKQFDDNILRLMSTTDHYESRQWDYKRRMKNPLFGRISEEERQALLLEGSLPSQTTQFGTQRKRSNSMGGNQNSITRRMRSISMGDQSCSKGRVCEKFSEEFNQSFVHHVRNELEQLRFERNKAGSIGCNCRKLLVYIPPKDGSGGKKSKNRRLKPSKLVQELKKRDLYQSVAFMSREKQEQILQKAVEKEPCCGDDDCVCFRNGITCQADACSCWYARTKNDKDSDDFLPSDIRNRCGNPLGTLIVDLDSINEYRKKTIKESQQQQPQSH